MNTCPHCYNNFKTELSLEDYEKLVKDRKNRKVVFPSQKQCTMCLKSLPIEDFAKGSKSNKYGLKPKCRMCDRMYMKKYNRYVPKTLKE